MSQTVVIIHGAFAGAWCFDNFADVFRARGWTCHAPDLRFHGLGPNLDPDPHLAMTSIRDYTEDMATFVGGWMNPQFLLATQWGG